MLNTLLNKLHASILIGCIVLIYDLSAEFVGKAFLVLTSKLPGNNEQYSGRVAADEQRVVQYCHLLTNYNT